MITQYKVLITDAAVEDINSIYDYIANELLSPGTAADQYDRIEDAILTLESFPERNRVMDSPREREKGLRMLLVDHYCVFYCISADKVYVTDVLYSACDYEERLKGL